MGPPSPPNCEWRSARSTSICSINSFADDSGNRRRRVLDDPAAARGRNLPFFLRHRFDVRAVDSELLAAIRSVRQLAASLHPEGCRQASFIAGPLDALPWEDGSTDAVICSAVLHFAERDEREFAAMLEEMWRILAPGGLFFGATGDEHRPRESPLIRHWTRGGLPDGSERFVVDEPTLLRAGRRTSGGGRSPTRSKRRTWAEHAVGMTTWVMEKKVKLAFFDQCLHELAEPPLVPREAACGGGAG